jgi:DUF4097 and DUF4098 domain-containing protein YvlB
MKRLIYGAIIGLFALISTASAEKFSRTETKFFNISQKGKVFVENVNGSVKVEGWDKDQVSLEITKTARADDSEEADRYFDRMRVEIESGDNYLRVRTHYTHHDDWDGFFSWLFHGFGSHGGDVSYVLKVPAYVKTDVHSTNGEIEVHSVAGDVKASTTNGRLTLDGVSGLVDGSTTNGSITASLTDAVEFKGLDLRTTNGSIKVSCPADISANVYAHTTNGSVSTDFPVTVRGGFLSKELEGTINNGGPEIRLHTTNGSIHINKH